MNLTTNGNDPQQDLELIRDRINDVWRVEHDPNGSHNFAETATTVGAAGSAEALPANPTGFIVVLVDGARKKIPYYDE